MRMISKYQNVKKNRYRACATINRGYYNFFLKSHVGFSLMISGIPLQICGYKLTAVINRARLITARVRYFSKRNFPRLVISKYKGYFKGMLLSSAFSLFYKDACFEYHVLKVFKQTES